MFARVSLLSAKDAGAVYLQEHKTVVVVSEHGHVFTQQLKAVSGMDVSVDHALDCPTMCAAFIGVVTLCF